MNFYRHLDIKNKLLFIFLLQMLLPIVILGVFVISNVENSMKSQALTLSQDMLKVLELRISDFANDSKMVSQDLLYDLELYAVLNGNEDEKFDYYSDVNDLKNVLRTLTLSNDEIQAIAVIDAEERNYAYDSENGRLSIQNYLPYDGLLALAREAGGGVAWYIDTAGEQTEVYLTRVINDIDTFNEVGLLVIQVDLSQLEHDYQALTSELFETIAVLDDQGTTIFSNKAETIDFNSNDFTGVFYEDDENDRMMSYRQMDNPNWIIVTSISRSSLLDEVNKFTKYAFIIFIPLGILLSLFTIFEGMNMVASIHKVVESMKQLDINNKHTPIEVDRYDELGFLADTYNEMACEIDTLVHDIYKEQLTRKEVELKALQAQINPHFLYNTLETINWHAQLKGAPEISDMVTALSSIMEATIGRDHKLITFRDELKYIENYISIMKYRYAGRIKYNQTIDPSIMAIKIPRLILQPIVENAINHGIAQTTQEGEINILAKIINDQILIEVCDNGKGMTSESLEAVNDRINRKHEGGSIGLENVNKRLKLFYGNEFGISLQSEANVYTKVIMKIPVKNLKEGDSYYE